MKVKKSHIRLPSINNSYINKENIIKGASL